MGRVGKYLLLLAALTRYSAIAIPPAQPAVEPAVTRITVDAASGRHPISPYIYGVSFGTSHTLADIRSPLNRFGGDGASLYNWEIDAQNAGRDWFFESVPCTNGLLDRCGDSFVAESERGGARAMLTIPMIGWVALLGPNRSTLASFSVAKYGLQRLTDTAGFADAGDGVDHDGHPVLNNDPHDAAQPDSLETEANWLRQLKERWNTAALGGVPFYLLDNEPSRWHDIHRDVHPGGVHASELADKTIAFAAMVKSVDPSAKVVAPEESGWSGMRDSGFDQQLAETNDVNSLPDRKQQTGGMDLLPWLLTQWKAAGTPVDVVSVHFYPQSGEYRDGSDDLSPEMQLMRNRSTRLLWDASYMDTSWIHDTVALIPRLRGWVDRFYHPGTPTAITEYNWGGENSMNGATTEADILGIFGHEGLFMANRWIAPAEGTPTYLAMKLFRNYDDHGGAFGETSVAASAPDPDKVSTFAALRTQDKALTVIVINKQLKEAAPIALSVAHFAREGKVESILLADGPDGVRIAALPVSRFRNSSFQAVLPPQSVTLLILHNAS